jgi:GntR family transcriptional regulator
VSSVDLVSWDDRAERIDHDAAKFVWLQIADDIAADIASGVLPVGSRLPSEVALAEVYGVARNTVRRAIAELVERGLITVLHGRGTFVVEQD